MKLCQRIEIPESIKSIFTCPAHETKWDRLEEARLATAKIIQGERQIEDASEADTEALISALQRCSSIYPDELCGHDDFPDGSRVVVEASPSDLSVAQQRAMVCDTVRAQVEREHSLPMEENVFLSHEYHFATICSCLRGLSPNF